MVALIVELLTHKGIRRTAVQLQRSGVQLVGCKSEIGDRCRTHSIQADSSHDQQRNRYRDLQRGQAALAKIHKIA